MFGSEREMQGGVHDDRQFLCVNISNCWFVGVPLCRCSVRLTRSIIRYEMDVLNANKSKMYKECLHCLQ